MATGNTIQIYQGNHRDLTWTVNDSAGADLDLTGYTIRFKATRRGQTVAALSFESGTDAELTISDAATGACLLELADTDTELLPGFYDYECEIQAGGGDVETVLVGTLEIVDSQFTTVSGE